MRVIFVIHYTGDEYNGIMSISSVLKKRGYQVEAVEAEYAKVKAKLNTNIPTILAYSTPTVLAEYYLKLNNQIKKILKVFSVFGGPHPTAVPEIIEEEGVDGVCIGEGEHAMLELVENMSSGKSIANIKNWWIKEDGRIYKNTLRPLIDNLDNLPFPDRNLFRGQSLFDKEKMHVLTGRGCLYSCSYCCHSYYNRLYEGQLAKIRKRSVGNIIEEIKQFKKRFPLRFVIFDDDIFILPYEWLKEFSLQYKRDINLPFFCNVRADLITYQVVSYLKNAGCHSVSFGLETSDDFLRNNFLNRNMTKEQIIAAAKLIKGQKIKLKTSNIIGIPGASIDTDIDTLKLNIKCKVDYTSVYLLASYPRTEISKKFDTNDSRFYASSYKNSYQRRLIKNLHNLFALAVEFPFFIYLIRILIKLPLIILYKFFYLLWEGYCAYFRLYPAGIMAFFRGVRKYIKILKLNYQTDLLFPGFIEERFHNKVVLKKSAFE